uniref:[histone H3]-lysine(4) N-trimethyltransferase n=1 Tax=Dicentrarchus labrax TaxID=13489 RepID=A0A8C4DM92_DICLA
MMIVIILRFVSPGKGNGVRATAGIKRGELVYSAEPLAGCVSNKVARDVCHHCFTRRETLLRCSQCKMARYCNSTCQKQAWSGHKRECKCLQSLRPRIPTDSVRLAARLIFAMVCFWSFPLVTCNCFTISDGELQEIGVGLYPSLSLLNHDCRPNCVMVFEGTKLQLRAVQDINPEEELTISYIETLSLTEDRQRQLEDQYHFTCHCQNCDSQDKDRLMLSGEKSTWRLLKEALPRLEALKAESNWQALLESWSHLLSTVGGEVPDENLYKLKMTDMALDASIHLGNWEDAVGYGEKTLPVYRQYYPDPHPAHGVQLMRVGKLQHYLEHIEDALDTFKEAYQIIKVTHGDDHPMTTELLMKMEECRAEMVQQSSETQPHKNLCIDPMLM